MIFQSFHEVQQVMLRTFVRNMMFFATLPFYLAQETGPITERSRRAGSNQLCAARRRGPAVGPERHPRTEDIRWLR